MHFTLVFAILLPISHAIDTGTPGVPDDLPKQYRVNFDTRDNGACQGFEDLLKTSYSEAFMAVEAAKTSLNFFIAPKPEPKQDRLGVLRWNRIGRTLEALFAPHKTDNFESLQKDIRALPHLNGVLGPPSSVYCSSGWRKMLHPTDEDPTDTEDPKRSISITHPHEDAPAWLYSIPDNKLGDSKNANFNDPCGPDNLAFTIFGFSAITFCLDTLESKTDVKATITDEKDHIQTGDPIGNHRTIAEMWVHEYVGQDFDAIDAQGRPKTLPNGDPEKSYGWDNIVNLARFTPDRARRTPDAYELFANAMFYDNFDWSNGRAAPLKT
ncbi:uncharacterized protein JN550_005899 [Neoarthrinium moseri]|uniref:uncharacterized protein n=1 Tax=Neoarthrinium moseri TaxID=1658444 RepID=UPI001FDD404D|nr:uncharacterized protein JN550_005899 [Neoarthrinium moseri]KAI1869269.1 hypothetical protein JN550_005899 [Neoarthrinium moseri]